MSAMDCCFSGGVLQAVGLSDAWCAAHVNDELGNDQLQVPGKGFCAVGRLR